MYCLFYDSFTITNCRDAFSEREIQVTRQPGECKFDLGNLIFTMKNIKNP